MKHKRKRKAGRPRKSRKTSRKSTNAVCMTSVKSTAKRLRSMGYRVVKV